MRWVMPGRLLVEEERCTGCTSCVLTCSFAKEGFFSFSRSRIRILRDQEFADFRPRVCVQCAEAHCISACPVGALSRDGATGAIVLDERACIGCRKCVEACPYGGVAFDEEREKPLICDLCGGEPACVEVCRFPEAIRYQEVGG